MRIFAKNIFASPPCLLHYFHWAITPLCLDRINLNARALTHVPEITFLCKSFSKWQLCTVPFKIISIFFRGFLIRKKLGKVSKQQGDDDLPDLKCAEVANATIKIQKVYRGFQTRKQLKEKKNEDLPDLKSADVANAAVKIQKVYRGFQTRQKMKEELPDLKCAKVAAATIKIQKVYRGFRTRYSYK